MSRGGIAVIKVVMLAELIFKGASFDLWLCTPIKSNEPITLSMTIPISSDILFSDVHWNALHSQFSFILMSFLICVMNHMNACGFVLWTLGAPVHLPCCPRVSVPQLVKILGPINSVLLLKLQFISWSVLHYVARENRFCSTLHFRLPSRRIHWLQSPTNISWVPKPM